MADGRASRGLTAPNSSVPSDAVVGWRYWQVPVTCAPVLTSVSHRWSRWPAGAVLRAVCPAGGHPAPAAGCGCGIYATLDLPTLRDHGLCLTPAPLLVGEVSLWGRMIREQGQVRAELGAPRRLWIVRETVPSPERDDLAGALKVAYRVPVDEMSLDEAVGEMSAVLLANQIMARKASALPAPDVAGGAAAQRD